MSKNVKVSSTEEINDKESVQVAGGKSNNNLKTLVVVDELKKHRNGPYTCLRCGKEYYLGNREISREVCLDCWQNPERFV